MRLRTVASRISLPTAEIHRLCIQVVFTLHDVAVIGYLTLIGDQIPLAEGINRKRARASNQRC